MPLAGPVFVRAAASAPTRIAFGIAGAEANNASQNASLSADGRYALFESLASNLVAGDTNGTWDIFARDLVTGVTTRLSTSSSGGQTVGSAMNAHFDAGGQRVVFDSNADDCVARGDANHARDVFLKDLATGATTLVSSNAAGLVGNGDSVAGVVSRDGGRVAFESLATNLTGADSNGARDIFVKDLTTGQISRVSTDAAGGEANGQSASVEWSADGRRILFESNATNLVGGDTNGAYDIFLKDLTTGAISRVSTVADGGQANGHSFHAHFTADGAGVVFESQASNLVAGDTNNSRDVFVKDLATGAVTRLSTDLGGGQLGGSSYLAAQGGGWTAFESNADATGGDTNVKRDIFLTDLRGGGALRVSLGAGGAQGNADAFHPYLSADGSTVLFESAASNLASGDANGARDVFMAKLTSAVDSGAVATNNGVAAGTLYFDDGNAAAAHSATVLAPQDALGSLAVTVVDATGAGAGRIDWRFTADALAPLAAGVTATQSFGILLSDGTGHSATQAITLTLTGVNDGPVAAADALRLDAGAVFDLSTLLLANDSDVDRGDRLAVASVDTAGTLGLVQFDASTGHLTYAADAAQLLGLGLGETATDHFAYTVQDLSGATARAEVTVTIDGIVPLGPTEAADTLRAAAPGELMDGMGGDDNLLGGAGADTLVGGSGADRMEGGGGDDVYSVDSLLDTVVEAPGGGHDTIVSTIDLALTNHIEDLILVGDDLHGTGNAAANRIVGGDGADVLDGGAGADTLSGGLGNDVYVIDNAGDTIVEAAGGGTDLIRTVLDSYTLADNSENLAFEGSAGAVGTGNAAANRLQGGDYADVLRGLGGDDYLAGGAGADMLSGGAGADLLRGGAGADVFVLARGEANGDTILDFNTSSVGDTLQLLGWGAGTTVAALGAGDWAIHDGVDGHVETIKIVGDVHPQDVVIG